MGQNFIGNLNNTRHKASSMGVYLIATAYAIFLISLIFRLVPLDYSFVVNNLAMYIFLAYILIVAILGFIFSRELFLAILFFPFLPVVAARSLFDDRGVRKFLEKNKIKQNVHLPTVVIVTYQDRTGWMGWLKPGIAKDELKIVLEYLNTKKCEFSFYLQASREDVDNIMRDHTVKEVCFLGHGSSHIFRLSTKQVIYYCDFSGNEYAKEFVHQVHCGDKEGRKHRLIDYVVPENNKKVCVWFDKTVTGSKIEKDLKSRIERLKAGKQEVE